MQRPPTHPGTTRRPALNNATALHNDSLSLPRAAVLHDCSLPSTSTLSRFRRVNVHRRRQCTDWVASEITYCSQFDSDNCLRRRVGAGTLLKVISETVTTRIYMGRTQRNERFRVGLYACVFTRSRGFVCQRFLRTGWTIGFKMWIFKASASRPLHLQVATSVSTRATLTLR